MKHSNKKRRTDSTRTASAKANTLALKQRRSFKGSRYYRSGNESVQAMTFDTQGQHFTKNKYLPNNRAK